MMRFKGPSLEALSHHDLFSATRVCRDFNGIVNPILYRNVRFHLSGQILSIDRLLDRLEIFSMPGFNLTQYTRRVMVSGSWYWSYDQLESDLGQENMVSPAVRMFNALIATCISKMWGLREFIWDAHITPTQQLISVLSLASNLKLLQLRVSTNDTPFPYFHPTLRLDGYINLRSLTLIHINTSAILHPIGNVLFSSKNLDELSLRADESRQLLFRPTFDDWAGQKVLNLKTLDLRGFVDLDSPSQPMWDYLSLVDLKILTLETTPSLLENPENVWGMLTAGKTNLVSTSLITFIASFSGLESLCLTPSLQPQATHVIPSCLACLARLHSSSLRVLSVLTRNENEETYGLDQNCLEFISVQCALLEEFGFGLSMHNLSYMDHVFRIPLLRVLHIQTLTNRSDYAIEHNENCLREQVSKYLARGCTPCIQYIAFDAGPVYSLTRNPVRWSIISECLGYCYDTVIFRDRSLDWMTTYLY
ncbi:hypothetical protein BGW36DRAFT_393226 [Talaromyces proteolyticus]|uniref:F-box domain-containing protein n=1 Tax=Talaromyces proteolyticus TaxID=1131652 RepID=A0AAD4L4D7_9EURO|nr:uncharacterized protein BGW36DRAFT_393226 [Talaromyces proteolyticus]KAH8705683.1 hypothetical protein BGW36DRAFT_393226 [Talaromyces proteolyticus]